MAPLCYRRHRFPPEIIQHAIWLYLRFTLSYRDVEELLAERGLDISYETVRRWVLKFGPAIARRLRQRRPRPSNRWHLDEMVVRIAGERLYLWRAVDDEGEVLDMLVQRRRDSWAALRLMRKLLMKQGFVPTRNDGDLLIPESTHIRLATAGSNEGAQILRRPYSSTMGLISPLSAGRPGAGVWSTTPGCCSYAINAIMGERIVRFCRRLRSHSIGRGDASRPQLLRSQALSNGSSLKARGSGGRCR
jgi:transposase